MANISSNLVVLRNKKKREKKSIYSRYIKEFSFKSLPGHNERPCEVVTVPITSPNKNLNISNKNADTAAVRASAGEMSRSRSYADQVRDLLRNDPIKVDTLDRSKAHGRPPRPPLPPSVETRSTVRCGWKQSDSTSTSHQHRQLAPEDGAGRKVYVRNISGCAPVIKSKSSTFSPVIPR